MTRREQVLAALFTRLQTLPGPKLLRNAVLPESVPSGGLVILRDGDPGTPELTLSPISYLYRHVAELEVIRQGATDAGLDTLVATVGAAIRADPTLGGLADRVEAGAPRTMDLAIEGAPALRGAVIPVTLVYETGDPLA